MTRNEIIDLAKRQFVEDTEQGSKGQSVALPEVARTLGATRNEKQIGEMADLIVGLGLAALRDSVDASDAERSARLKSELLQNVRDATIAYRNACQRLGRMTAMGAADEVTRDEFEWTVRDAIDPKPIVWPGAEVGVAINGMIALGWTALDWANYEVNRG